MKIKPLNWQKEANSWHADGVSCQYSIHKEHDKARLFVSSRGGRPEVLDFDSYQGAMAYAQRDTQKRIGAWLETTKSTDNLKSNIKDTVMFAKLVAIAPETSAAKVVFTDGGRELEIGLGHMANRICAIWEQFNANVDGDGNE